MAIEHFFKKNKSHLYGNNSSNIGTLEIEFLFPLFLHEKLVSSFTKKYAAGCAAEKTPFSKRHSWFIYFHRLNS